MASAGVVAKLPHLTNHGVSILFFVCPQYPSLRRILKSPFRCAAYVMYHACFANAERGPKDRLGSQDGRCEACWLNSVACILGALE